MKETLETGLSEKCMKATTEFSCFDMLGKGTSAERF